jgi:mRNA interferase RelE/StbE
MASYEIIFKPAVEKDLKKLPPAVVKRVWSQLERLSDAPLPRQALKLTGSERLYRLRVGDYRIVYEVEAGKQEIIVHYIRHRREAYRQL